MKKIAIRIVIVGFVAAFSSVGLILIIEPGWCVEGRVPKACRTAVTNLTGGQLNDLRCIVTSSATEVAYSVDSLTIVADLYEPSDAKRTPGLLLLHGSSTYGRKLFINRILGNRFSARGYTVLAPDVRGYGESEDPVPGAGPEAFDFARDVEAALDFLLSIDHVDSNRLFVLGHSFGAGVALTAYTGEERIKKLVLVGPPRRMSKRSLNHESPRYGYFPARVAHDMGRSTPFNPEDWRAITQAMAIETYVDGNRRSIPMFLIDGQYENIKDRQFLRAISQQMPPSVRYWTQPATGHYLKTGMVVGFPCYNAPVVEAFVDTVSSWLEMDHESRSG